MKASI
jgi:2-oxoglutarate dehydrogenase E2 component (dihydrolipoamide succinyltransferase)